MNVQKIVLTGGPCGGKTTALARIAERVGATGRRVFCVPEAPTLLLQGGLSFNGVTPAQVVDIQMAMMRTVDALEERFAEIARVYGGPAVLLCDRGLMDVRAYVSEDVWQSILDGMGRTEVDLRDRRYDAVIHMVTAADGAEPFYTTANNAARHEGPELARDLDRRTQDAWVGHPHLRVIDNSTDFDEKVRRATAAACRVLGVPEPLEIERKFLIGSVPAELPVHSVTVAIEQTYLRTTDETEARVRRRGAGGSYVYTHTIKRRLGPGRAIEVERAIQPREYVELLAEADPECRPIRKRRTCFVWDGHYLELDAYLDHDMVTLEVEVSDIEEHVDLPPFLPVARELTGDPTYSNYRMARGLFG